MSYSYFEPKETIWSSVGSIFGYIKNNLRLVWASIQYYLPYLLVFLALSFSHQFLVQTIETKIIGVIALFAGLLGKAYIMPFFAITWHRIILQGLDEFVYANPLKPQKSEWKFIGFGALLFLTMSVFSVIGAISPLYLQYIADATPVGHLFLIAFALLVYFFVRASLVFPSIAVGSHLSIREVFALSKGYVWKIVLTGLLASVCMMLILLVLMVPFFLITSALTIFIVHSSIQAALLFCVSAAVQIFTEALGTMIGVMVLSNYYAVITKK
jgi:hypothetical protein